MNKAALAHFDRGEELISTSLLECHNDRSQELIIEILAAMQAGEEERLISDDETRRIYMRAVRDRDGQLLGYYERYESLTKSVQPGGSGRPASAAPP